MEKRVFKRKIYDRIRQWKQESNGESALMIQGARSIGKSTIAEEFAKKLSLKNMKCVWSATSNNTIYVNPYADIVVDTLNAENKG